MTEPERQPERQVLSYSRVNSLLTCGEQYRLSRVEKLPQQPSTAAIAGTIIHSATEVIDELLFYNPEENRALLSEQWRDAAHVSYLSRLEEIDKYSPEYNDPGTWKIYGKPTQAKPAGEDINWFITDAIPFAVESYIDWRLLGEWNIAALMLDDGCEPAGKREVPAIEVPFEISIGRETVRGYIDRVFVSAKTGAPLLVDLKSGVKPKNDAQLAIYSKALQTMGIGSFEWGAYYYEMKKSGGKMTPFINLSHWTDEMLVDLYEPAGDIIERELFVANPGDSCFHCNVISHCRYRRSSI